ncbi:hypothetical protein ACXR6G_17605 [Ancylomarina sp. YFZ004]
MKNVAAYSHIVEKEIQLHKIEARKILDKFGQKFNQVSLVVAQSFQSSKFRAN